jgi:hypothetical protein
VSDFETGKDAGGARPDEKSDSYYIKNFFNCECWSSEI